MLFEYRGKLGSQRLSVGDPILVARKTGIAGQFGFADLLTELAEGAVVADADEDVVGAGRKDRVGGQVGMLVAGELWRLAMHEIVRGMRVHDGEAIPVSSVVVHLGYAGKGSGVDRRIQRLRTPDFGGTGQGRVSGYRQHARSGKARAVDAGGNLG